MSKKHILILALVIICIVVLLVLWPGMSVDVSNDDSVPVTVGFINPDADNTYYADVEFSVQELAAEEGWNFITLDAAGDSSRIYVNAESLVNQRVDVAVTFNNMERYPSDAADLFEQVGVPFITLDNPLDNAIYCGYDHAAVGELLGKTTAETAQKKFEGGELMLSLQTMQPTYAGEMRMAAAMDIIKSKLGIADEYTAADSTSLLEEDVTARLTSRFQDSSDLTKIIILCENAGLAQYALQAVSSLEYSDRVVIGSFDDGSAPEVAANFESESNAWVCSVSLPTQEVKAQLRTMLLNIINRGDRTDAIIEPVVYAS